MYSASMPIKDPKKYQRRRKAANEAKASGLEAVAQKYSVTQQTVRRWCKEFGVQWATASTHIDSQSTSDLEPPDSASIGVSARLRAPANPTVDEAMCFLHDPDCSAAVLSVLAESSSEVLLREVSLHRACTSEVLQTIVDNTHDWVTHTNVATHRNCAPDTLAQLAGKEHIDVRWAVAAHPNTQTDTLNKLAVDIYPEVRSEIGRSVRASPQTLHRLANDTDRLVLCSVAANWGSGSATLDKILNRDVLPLEVYEQIASNPGLGPEASAELSQHGSNEVRRNLAQNPGTHPDALMSLAEDRHVSVRKALTWNKNAPRHVLQYLADNDPHADVRHSAAAAMEMPKQPVC